MRLQDVNISKYLCTYVKRCESEMSKLVKKMLHWKMRKRNGKIKVLFVETQTNYGLDPNDVHLIGHSLGAHTAGYAGEKMGGKVGRITGLDPAEPYFQGMPSHVRLDYTDAKLVDVIHTDGKSFFFLGNRKIC